MGVSASVIRCALYTRPSWTGETTEVSRPGGRSCKKLNVSVDFVGMTDKLIEKIVWGEVSTEQKL